MKDCGSTTLVMGVDVNTSTDRGHLREVLRWAAWEKDELTLVLAKSCSATRPFTSLHFPRTFLVCVKVRAIYYNMQNVVHGPCTTRSDPRPTTHHTPHTPHRTPHTMHDMHHMHQQQRHLTTTQGKDDLSAQFQSAVAFMNHDDFIVLYCVSDKRDPVGDVKHTRFGLGHKPGCWAQTEEAAATERTALSSSSTGSGTAVYPGWNDSYNEELRREMEAILTQAQVE
jgi:hypothetical protein